MSMSEIKQLKELFLQYTTLNIDKVKKLHIVETPYDTETSQGIKTEFEVEFYNDNK